MTQRGLLGDQLLGGGLLGQGFDSTTNFEYDSLETKTNTKVKTRVEITEINFNPLESDADTTSSPLVVEADRPQFVFNTILPLERSSRTIEFDLDSVGVWASGRLRWNVSTSSTTNFVVEVSKDNRNWTKITNSGDNITLFSSGEIVLGETLYVRMTLTAENSNDSPTLNNFKVDIKPD